MRPLISIIIPAHNSKKTINKCLESIFNLNYPDFEVVVVNDGSTDKTGEMVRSIFNEYIKSRNTENKSGNFKIIKTNGVGPSVARNMAIKEAKGEYIAFTDSDCIVDLEWLNELLKGFSFGSELLTQNSKPIIGVGGDQLSPKDETNFGRMIQNFMKIIGFITGYIKTSSQPSTLNCQLIEVDHNPTCNVMYKQKIFNEIDGFYPRLWPGEDVEFDYRVKKAGYKLVYNPDAKVHHYRPNNMKKFIRMMYRYGKVQSWLVRHYGFFRKLHYAPVILLIILIGLIWILSNSYSIFVNALIGMILFTYMYFVIRTKNLIKSVQFSFLLAVTILSWTSGFIADILSPNK